MDDPYEDRSMPADTTGRHIEQDDLLADLEDLKPDHVDYYAVLNLSKTVRKAAHYLHSRISFGKAHSDWEKTKSNWTKTTSHIFIQLSL